MAAKQAFYAEPYSARHAKAFDGLVGVLGAGRFKAARASEKSRQVCLVAAQCEQRKANAKRGRACGRVSTVADHGFFSSWRSSDVSTVIGAVATLGLGCMTMSHPAEIS